MKTALEKAYFEGYDSGWKMRHTPMKDEYASNKELYNAWNDGKIDGFNDWKYECSDCD